MCILPSVMLAGNVYNWPGALEVRFSVKIRVNEIRALAAWYVNGTWSENKNTGNAHITKY